MTMNLLRGAIRRVNLSLWISSAMLMPGERALAQEGSV